MEVWVLFYGFLSLDIIGYLVFRYLDEYFQYQQQYGQVQAIKPLC